ncbi:cysteine-rich repeat secretory protein 11-like [Senna tora]|uniref:Cysteine-rich repeat secretory protein 11-like n=1 Tax=Senna tora TaxID=362788 RepID=A0A834SJ81_9FABA|nr:cysteine-rich repeat secretory protein 11-like [Senna tora]
MELGFAIAAGVERRREEAGKEDGDGADENIAEPGGCVDLDHDGGVFGIEEVFVDTEDELLVPCGVCVTVLVNLGAEFARLMSSTDFYPPTLILLLVEVMMLDFFDCFFLYCHNETWAKGVSDYSYSRLGESESNDDEVVHKVCGGEYYGGEVLEGAFGALISGIDENGNGYYRGYYESVQMMAQCEAHMDTCQCTQCLTHALQQCPHSLSAQIYLPNCFITYVYHPNSFPDLRFQNPPYTLGGKVDLLLTAVWEYAHNIASYLVPFQMSLLYNISETELRSVLSKALKAPRILNASCWLRRGAFI